MHLLFAFIMFKSYIVFGVKSFFGVADVAGLACVKCEIADRSNECVDTECDSSEDEICQGSGFKALGLQARVVDNEAAYPAQEKC